MRLSDEKERSAGAEFTPKFMAIFRHLSNMRNPSGIVAHRHDEGT